ncbi:MAG: extracellular solute-binding protein [Sphaerochaetaceae bacterium]|jgi:putative spermidine/putrescine transport system substrate-binding protein
MKKVLALVLVLGMVLALLPAAGGKESAATENASGKPTVTVWTDGSQNVSDLFTALIEAYNARPESTSNVKLQFILSGTGDEGFNARIAAAYKTQQKGAGIDILANNTSTLAALADIAGSKDLFRDIDYSRLKNWPNVTMKPTELEGKLVPYRGTTVVFAYDSKRLPNPPTTWAELTRWIKANPGRFAYSSSGGAFSAFVRTATYHLIPDMSARLSNDPKWAEQWDPGFAWLKEIHPYLYKSGGSVVYPNKNQGSLDLLINSEVDMIPAWADQVLSNMANGTLPPTTKMTQMSDDALSGTDVSLSIASLSENPDACYDFIDFVISPVGQKICLEVMYAVPVINPDLIDSDMKNAVSGLDPSKFAILSIGDLGDKHTQRWEREIATLR